MINENEDVGFFSHPDCDDCEDGKGCHMMCIDSILEADK